ncbi:hypothetical protein TNCV_32731 [Trichonephila clavipes]|nr:hypothetical protein TNCV_32731 [Trichonephila clavipes]
MTPELTTPSLTTRQTREHLLLTLLTCIGILNPMGLQWLQESNPLHSGNEFVSVTPSNKRCCRLALICIRTATAGSDVVQSGRPIFDDFFQPLWPYIGNNTVNNVFQMVKRLWLIRIDQ